jgi:hypothetical protein
LAVRLPPLLRLARSSPRKRVEVVATLGFLIWLIEFEGLLGLMMNFSYWLGGWQWYAYSPSIKNFNNPTAVVIELWLRQLSLWGKLGHTCFSANVAACKVADAVFVSPIYRNPADEVLGWAAGFALVIALIAMGVGWWQTRAKSPRK